MIKVSGVALLTGSVALLASGCGGTEPQTAPSQRPAASVDVTPSVSSEPNDASASEPEAIDLGVDPLRLQACEQLVKRCDKGTVVACMEGLKLSDMDREVCHEADATVAFSDCVIGCMPSVDCEADVPLNRREGCLMVECEGIE